MGDARLTMKKESVNTKGSYYLPTYAGVRDAKSQVASGTPYETTLKWDTYTAFEKRESYYRALELVVGTYQSCREGKVIQLTGAAR